ncbi:MAG: hypothetical protein PHS06_03240, partial [Candidatus Shapirobacteria bacterium]|nr:hypothetical protein [Candidatus Shapirobacteria bacterium]
SGTVNLPTGSISNANLVNSSITISTGVGMSGGGTVSLGGTATLNLDLGSSNVWIGLQTFNGGIGIGSSALVNNLNSNYLNGISSAGFIGIGQTGNFITTLTNGNGIIISGSGTSRSIGVSSPTCTGTDKLQWNGSAFICSVDVGSSYTAGVGLTLSSSNVFSLNLGSSNVWLGLQTFNGGIGIGSSDLVTNLNSNYLNGISSSGFVGIGQTGNFISVGQTGSLPYVNNVTDSSLTRSGAGPYTIALNLGNSNVWTGLQTFNGGIGVSGTVNLPTGSISNANLVNSSITISTGVGMSGGGTVSLGGTATVAVNLTTSGTVGSTASNSGLEVSASGLTLLKGCNDGQILKYTDAGGWACQSDASGGASSLNSITAADGTNTINNGDNQQVWNWNMTSASKTAFTFGENVASTNGAGSQYLVGISTLAGSTAAPLKVSAQGNIILDTTSAGGLTFGSTTANSSITMQSGTGTINIGTDANAKTISIGTTTGAAALNLISGTGGINIGTGTANKNINIGTGAANNVISIGTTSGTSSLNLWAGTGGINIGSGATAKTINIGTGAAAITMFIGSTNTTSATTIQSGSGNIAFTVGGVNSSGKVIIGNSGTTAPDLLVLDNGTTDPTGTNGATYYNSSTNKFRCYENSIWKDCVTSEIQKTRSFVDTNVTTFADNNTTTIFIGATRPNITLSSASNKILVMISVGLSAAGTGNDTPVGTIRRGIGATPVCDNAHTGQVDSFFGRYSSDAVSLTATNTFLDDPATTSTVYYTLCTDSTSVMADTVYKTSATVTLIEVSNSNADLAEVYSATDKTIGAGDVVSLDSNLKSGVKKSTGSYEKGLVGVVSSTPAITIGSVDDNETSAVPVALSGRVPVKVNTENGPIKAGDPLTSSSTPGVAMKATKAGAIIGTAMSDFDGEGTGHVLVFIKNGVGNGTKIADLLPGVDENAADFAKQILDELMWQKDNLVLTDLSEIITDRLVAGVEIITPKIVTDKTQTKNLCVGEENNETCITKSQLDQILLKMDIGGTTPTPMPTPTGVGATLDTTGL